MEAAVRNSDIDGNHIQEEKVAPRSEATFTEIYELILNNRSLVTSELNALQQLIQKKLRGKNRGLSATPAVICGNTR